MFSEFKHKKIRDWCLFDFGISSYPTLVITFIYGAFYAKEIAITPEIGTSNWGYAISTGSILSFLIFLLVIFKGNKNKNLGIRFFKLSFYSLILSVSLLYCFDKESNEYLPLIFIAISFVAFEIINLFYNLSLHNVSENEKRGLISNLGWATGYLGGLLSLISILAILNLTELNDYKVFGQSIFLLIGPFVGIWTFVFGLKHMNNYKNKVFKIDNFSSFFKNIKINSINKFFVSYFFFNNAVICIFAFASMIASFLFGFSEKEILKLGIFINLFGIIGCLSLGKIEDRVGSEKIVLTCIVFLLLITFTLYFINDTKIFWLLSLMIGFFIGPIQAASRSVLAKKLKSENQLSAFCVYSMFGNICSILGPFLVSLVISISSDIRQGLLVIPLFFVISLLPFVKTNV